MRVLELLALLLVGVKGSEFVGASEKEPSGYISSPEGTVGSSNTMDLDETSSVMAIAEQNSVEDEQEMRFDSFDFDSCDEDVMNESSERSVYYGIEEEGGMDMEARSDDEIIPCVNEAIIEAAKCGNLEAVRQMISLGASIESVGDSGCTLLGSAAASGNLALIAFLLDSGCKINRKDLKFGAPALFYAASSISVDAVKFLLARGADMRVKDRNGDTVLGRAVTGMGPDNFEYLLDNGGNALIYERNAQGQTVMDIMNKEFCFHYQRKRAALSKYL